MNHMHKPAPGECAPVVTRKLGNMEITVFPQSMPGWCYTLQCPETIYDTATVLVNKMLKKPEKTKGNFCYFTIPLDCAALKKIAYPHKDALYALIDTLLKMENTGPDKAFSYASPFSDVHVDADIIRFCLTKDCLNAIRVFGRCLHMPL